jgi:hypothetical protein
MGIDEETAKELACQLEDEAQQGRVSKVRSTGQAEGTRYQPST